MKWSELMGELEKIAIDHFQPPVSGSKVMRVYKAYHKKVDPPRAKVSIKKAIQAHGFDVVYNGTVAFTKTMKCYGVMGAKHKLWGIVPNPTTFFNNERYKLTPADWSAPFREGAYVEPDATPVDKKIPEAPEQWVAAYKNVFPDHPEVKHGDWDFLYEYSRDMIDEVIKYLKDPEGYANEQKNAS